MIEVKISGIDEINKILEALPKQMSKTIIDDALRVAAKPIIEDAKARIHSRSGLLARSIRVKKVRKEYAKSENHFRIAPSRIKVKKKGKSVSLSAFYAHMVEGGTDPHRIPKKLLKKVKAKVVLAFGGRTFSSVQHPGITGQRFMAKAYAAKSSEAYQNFVNALGPALEKHLKRRFKS